MGDFCMFKPNNNWSWRFNHRKKILTLVFDNGSEYELSIHHKNLAHLSHIDRVFTVEDAVLFDYFFNAVDQYFETDDLKFNVIINALASKNFHKPILPKSWFFKEQTMMCSPNLGDIVTLTTLDGHTLQCLAVENSGNATLLLSINVDDIDLNSTKQFCFLECMKVMNNRIRTYIHEPKVFSLVV